jgi:hypothetical protein
MTRGEEEGKDSDGQAGTRRGPRWRDGDREIMIQALDRPKKNQGRSTVEGNDDEEKEKGSDRRRAA